MRKYLKRLLDTEQAFYHLRERTDYLATYREVDVADTTVSAVEVGQ